MAQVKQEIEQSRAERRMDAPETPAAEPAAGVDTPQAPMTEREMDGFLDAMLARPRNMARLFRSATIRTGTWMSF